MEADLERVTMLEEYTVLADSEEDAVDLILDGYGDMVGEPSLMSWTGDPEERIVSVHIDTPTEGHLLNRDEDI